MAAAATGAGTTLAAREWRSEFLWASDNLLDDRHDGEAGLAPPKDGLLTAPVIEWWISETLPPPQASSLTVRAYVLFKKA